LTITMHPSHQRTRELAAQDNLQGAAQRQPLRLEDRQIASAVLVLLHVEHDYLRRIGCVVREPNTYA